ncbi:LysM peptidoglycan-binding domain-containing protein [uncultured Demequina sp.]|uniref:CIS tube protein n=1 Tax=uncultured Demequina sp. TaxID=693499 RepID=UPI002600FE67|nr:LysM peptidoglycan-binding domain-containing protein [uncultured Demequina sp.]
MLETTQLTKLRITPFEDQEFDTAADEPWQAMLNPTEIGYSRAHEYAEEASAGASAPQQSYSHTKPEDLKIDMILDGTGVVADKSTLADQLDRLLEMTRFTPGLHQPYYVRVEWGALRFEGAVRQVDLSYKLFDRDGQPLRVAVSLSLKGVVGPEKLKAEERRESPDLFQTWLVSEGESLDAIAHRVYGDPAFWRPLAEANDLRNPRGIVAGQTLLLPPKDKGR